MGVLQGVATQLRVCGHVVAVATRAQIKLQTAAGHRLQPAESFTKSDSSKPGAKPTAQYECEGAERISIVHMLHTDTVEVAWESNPYSPAIKSMALMPSQLCDEEVSQRLKRMDIPFGSIVDIVRIAVGFHTGGIVEVRDMALVRCRSAASARPLYRFVKVTQASLFHSTPDASAPKGLVLDPAVCTSWLVGTAAPELPWGIAAAGFSQTHNQHVLQLWRRKDYGYAEQRMTSLCTEPGDALIDVACDGLHTIVTFVERNSEKKLLVATKFDLCCAQPGYKYTQRLGTRVLCGTDVCGSDVAIALRDEASGAASVRVVTFEKAPAVRCVLDVDLTAQIPRAVRLHGGMLVIASRLDGANAVSMCHSRSPGVVHLHHEKGPPLETLLAVASYYVAYTTNDGRSIEIYPHPMQSAHASSRKRLRDEKKVR